MVDSRSESGVLVRALALDRPGLLREEEVLALLEELAPANDAVVLLLPGVLDAPLASGAGRWVDDLVLIVYPLDDRQHDLELVRTLFDGQGVAPRVIAQ